MKQKLKICIISSIGPKPYLGGIENVIDTLLKSNLRNNHDFMIYDTYRKPDINRTNLDKALFVLRLVAGCSIFLLKKKPNTAHIHFCSNVDFWKHAICLLISKIFGIRVIFHLHGGSFDAFYHERNFINKAIIKFCLKKADLLIALSGYWKKFLTGITGLARILIVPNPVNCNELSKFYHRDEPENQRNIVLLGSLGKRKGHYDVLKALPVILEKYGDACICFAGIDEDPGATKTLKNIAKEMCVEENVQFLGAVSGDRKLKLLADSAVIILPSYGENLPISILEGMAAAKPVITTKVGAIPEMIVNGYNGLMIEAGDWLVLAEKIIYIFDHPDEAKTIGRNAYLTIRRKYDINEIEPIFNAVYKIV